MIAETGQAFPISIEGLSIALRRLLVKQGADRYAWILRDAVPSIQYIDTSSYGGVFTIWRLLFAIPIDHFAEIEDELKELEENLLTKVRSITRGLEGHQINDVSLIPELVPANAQASVPPSSEVEHIWGNDTFRLFISHLVKDKVFLTELKDELLLRGIVGFVAHKDIKPTKLWQLEIELALCSMQAMVVYLSDGFIESKWTDQEVGWAMGRGVLVLPIKVAINPYGFMGKFQALPGYDADAKALAERIVHELINHPQTHEAMRKALVHAMVNSDSYATSRTLLKPVLLISDFTEPEKAGLREACVANRQVRGAYDVKDAIYSHIGHALNRKLSR